MTLGILDFKCFESCTKGGRVGSETQKVSARPEQNQFLLAQHAQFRFAAFSVVGTYSRRSFSSHRGPVSQRVPSLSAYVVSISSSEPTHVPVDDLVKQSGSRDTLKELVFLFRKCAVERLSRAGLMVILSTK